MGNLVKHFFTISCSKGYAIKGRDEIIVVGGGTHVALAPQRKPNNFVNPLNVLGRIRANKCNVIGLALGFHHRRSSISKFLFLEMVLDP